MKSALFPEFSAKDRENSTVILTYVFIYVAVLRKLFYVPVNYCLEDLFFLPLWRKKIVYENSLLSYG